MENIIIQRPVGFRPKVWDDLEKAAKKVGKSRPQLIRDLADDYLKNDNKDTTSAN